MNTLVSAFWGEGSSDRRFLPVLIQRTLEAIMQECAEGEWDIHEPVVLHPNRKATDFVAQIADLSRQSAGFQLLFIHTDADAEDENEKAMPFKIVPAIEAVDQAQPAENYCKGIVAVVPVVKVENWKLADSDALRNVIGTELTDAALGMNIGTKQLEKKSASKELLSDILRKTNQGKRIPVDLADLDAALAKSISLNKIHRFKSFQQFVHRLKTALIRQNIIRTTCAPQL